MFLAHGDFAWVLGGVVVFAGLMIFLAKIVRGKFLDVIIGGVVWFFVYAIHGGTGAGIMTATLAALLFDLMGMPLLKLMRRLK